MAGLTFPTREHGGPDAQGPARWDFSACANAAGPCPDALAAVRQADITRYPDPASTAVRQALATLHGVEPWRVLPAASASEFIQRFTAVTGRLWPGAVQVPEHAYGDYAHAALAWGREVVVAGRDDQGCTLRWHADPSSPLGQDDAPPATDAGRMPTVLDAVYAPLRLSGHSRRTTAAQDTVFVLHSPNKALGLCGLRGAYAIAPRPSSALAYDLADCCAALEAAAPSWPLSAQGDALLQAWARDEVQTWVANSRATLAAWKASLQQQLQARGFTLQPSHTPFFVASPPPALAAAAAPLRAAGVAVRDTTGFGLPGGWRLSAQPPAAQQALLQALDRLAPPP